jgi:hypothetical protein
MMHSKLVQGHPVYTKEKRGPDQEINEPKWGIGVSLNRLKITSARFPCKLIRSVINRRKRLFANRREPTLQKTLYEKRKKMGIYTQNMNEASLVEHLLHELVRKLDTEAERK